MAIERLATSEFRPSTSVFYKDVYNLHALYKRVAFGANLVLVGPKGIGKTLSVAAYASEIGCPIVTFDCSEDVRRNHLYGAFILRGSESPFVLGPIPTAVEIANEVGRCILCLEEVNALSPQSQKLLNPISDFRSRIELPEAHKVFRLKGNSQLWIVATMNTSVYGGVYLLNEDLKSRFRMIPLDYPTEVQELSIVGSDGDPTIVKQVLTLAKESRQGHVGYALSTRDVEQVLADIKTTDIKTALWMVSGKFEGEDRTWLQQRVRSIFGITLKGSKKNERK
jgi:nitric oxide reductase NorQ protein